MKTRPLVLLVSSEHLRVPHPLSHNFEENMTHASNNDTFSRWKDRDYAESHDRAKSLRPPSKKREDTIFAPTSAKPERTCSAVTAFCADLTTPRDSCIRWLACKFARIKYRLRDKRNVECNLFFLNIPFPARKAATWTTRRQKYTRLFATSRVRGIHF